MRKTEALMLELDRKLLRDLLEVVALGEWMANAHTINGDKYRAIEQRVLELAGRAVSELVDDSDPERLYLNATRDDRIEPIIDEYNAMTLCTDLAEQLAFRDLRLEVGEKALRRMQLDTEGMARIAKRAEHYIDEFERHGMDRLHVVEKQ